ncbi:MAG: lysophospholipid acyltransferase family protein [Candidatus Curtissbacteria bacterium]|nr:lysophospholipid acyltransferase family protein [Candidatus Curtissbacteria bacterium]
MSERPNALRIVGNIVGKNLIRYGLDFERLRVNRFRIQTIGEEHLTELADRSFVIVANHVQPEGRNKDIQSGLSPDALVLEKVIKELTGKQLTAISLSQIDSIFNIPLPTQLRDKVIYPVTRGILESIGFIPLKREGFSSHKAMLKTVEKEVMANNPILVFPQGHKYADFDPSKPFNIGAAHIAQSFTLPIIPVYLDGCHTWEPHLVRVFIGKPFFTAGRTKKENSQRIKEEISALALRRGGLQHNWRPS